MQQLRLLLSPEPENPNKRILPPMIIAIFEHQTPQGIFVINHMFLLIQPLSFCLLYLLLTDSITGQFILQVVMGEINLDLI